jgi:FtsH-binding integral membrane protein
VNAGKLVLEALILTSAVVSSLTGYTFWASKKGKDFSYLGPILFTSLFVLILTGFLQVRSCFHLPGHVLD